VRIVRSRIAIAIAIVASIAMGGSAGCNTDPRQGSLGPLAPASTTGLGNRAAIDEVRVAPAFDPANFVSRIDNPYFPLVPGTTFSYREPTTVGIETIDLEVTHDTKVILGVIATVVRDRVYVDGSLVEDTFDWYAQDKQGNVWYLGEAVEDYKDGVVVSTAGSWEAGKDGATPGIIMLARPRIGTTYRQELAPGVAEDQATVVSLAKSVSVPHGTFRDCVQTMEFSRLAPGSRGYKFYAPGVGLVMELSPAGGRGRVELISVVRP